MASRFLEIQNSVTQEVVYVDTYRSRYQRLAQGFLNHLKLNGGFLKHIILTQSEESYHPKILNNFLMALKKRFGKLHYLWTVEIQEHRLEKYGKAVMHWHILCAFPEGTWFDSEGLDIAKIQSYWKYGDMTNSVEVRSVRSPSLTYLLKYTTKALCSPVAEKVRRIGSSMIAGYLRQSWTKLSRLLENTVCSGWCSLDELKLFSFSRNGSAFVHVTDENGERSREKIYDSGKSAWSVIGRYDETPF